MEDEQRGEVRDCVIQGVYEGEGQTGCAVCDRQAREEVKEGESV